MEKKVDKVKEFVFQNYKLIIPISLMLVIFLGFIIYYFASKTFVYSKTETGSYYQYFDKNKTTYDIDITKDKKGVITNINPTKIRVEYDSTPIYDSEEDIVIFPSDMSVVMPIVNCSEYLTKKYSYIVFENKRYNLITEKFNDYLGHYFLYDGDNLYFFIEEVTLFVNDKEIELSPFSFIVANGKNISYYDKKNDKYVSLTSDKLDYYINNEYYKVYLNSDKIDYYGDEVILTSGVDQLNTIDEMKRSTDK